MGESSREKVDPRVVHVVPALFGAEGVFGGAERYALGLARSMAECTPTTLLTFGDQDRSETLGELRIRVIGEPWRVRGQQANPMSWSLFRHLAKADIVHCHQQHILASSLAALFCRSTGRRVFVSDLGGGGFDFSSYLSTDRWYHGHLHISEFSRRVSGHAGNPSAAVIYGGVDTMKFSPAEATRREPVAVFVGRVLPHKGVNDLVAAMPEGLRLEIIGQHYDEQFSRDLRQMASQKNVIFRADCDDDALVEIYRRAICVVMPSVYHSMYGGYTPVPELLGTSQLEGMGCGTPAIVTDVGGLPETVIDGVTGFIVPPHDPAALGEKISWLAANPARLEEMGRAARRNVVERFTWPVVVRRCLEIYRAKAGEAKALA